jgi:putative FmdB family regulatory protein
MPIYELRCPGCGFEFEELLPLGGSADCEVCGQENATLKLSGFHSMGSRIPAVTEIDNCDVGIDNAGRFGVLLGH